MQELSTPELLPCPPPPTTPPLKKQGVENGKVWVLRVALPSHRQEKSAQRGGGGGER